MARAIPSAGINLFQFIYVLLAEYERRSGLPALNLSLGNPDGIPPQEIRDLQARFCTDPGYDFHTYAEDKDLLDFCDGMVELHGRIRFKEHAHLRATPIAGIKTATALIPLACGLHLPDRRRRAGFAMASNLPAYDVSGTWCGSYLGAKRVVWPLYSAEDMHLCMAHLETALRRAKVKRPDLIFVIRPGNPASVGASASEWQALIQFCLAHETRLVNDAAYSGLSDETHVPLAAVAKDYPDLEWLELYSVSKSFSDPGARLGAVVGSKDFVEDYITIKGNTDSGPVPALMAAYGRFFQDRETARRSLESLYRLYRSRLDYVIPALKKAGLRQACPTNAGFFTLWKVPRKALGQDLAALARRQGLSVHEAYNRLAISETGIVGVHFAGFGADDGPEPLVRYAVCADVLSQKFQTRFETELARLEPRYD
ncbi:MAG: pyridoxal phosphate-dependent aminotransferase [Elusimicrobia bacterium]|nr:pyridoxal phosphate-dependent aminotransferase [Elusimicrobiota bacterium]